jgi:hypothetical protein
MLQAIRPLALVLLWLGLAATAWGQSCGDKLPASTPNSRFKDNGNGTLTDNKTGLIWKQCLEGQDYPGCSGQVYGYDWNGALEEAANSNFAGSSNWRVPSIRELESLVETGCSGPAINAALFPNVYSGEHWSSSPASGNPQSAWTVNFGSGYSGVSYRYSYGALRLVRGGS